MTDAIADTQSLARLYCPGCEPEADPSREILDVRWCDAHAPVRGGLDDDEVLTAAAWMSGSGEAGGEDNRRWCEVLHRAR